MAKMVPPHKGISWVDPHGVQYSPGPDGTVEVPEVYVHGLDAGWTRAPMARIAPAQSQKDLLEKFNALLAQLQDQGLMASV
jgi:hypothetical protein